MDGDNDVHAARTAGFRPTPQTVFRKKAVDLESDFADAVPIDARARVEINAKLVGMVEIEGAHRMRMKFDAAEVNNPRKASPVIDNKFLGGTAGRE